MKAQVVKKNNTQRFENEAVDKEAIYLSAIKKSRKDDIDSLNAAVELFSKISGWMDSDKLNAQCCKRIEELRADPDLVKRKKKKHVIVSVVSMAAIIVFFVIFFSFILPNAENNQKYNDAIRMMNMGNYRDAIRMFSALDGYKDSDLQIKKIYLAKYGETIGNELISLFFTTQVGDSFVFGSYEQDDNLSNGKEDVEWIVLSKDSGFLLLISKYALDYHKYYEYTESVEGWKESDLYTWLTDSFYPNAFTPSQQEIINRISILNEEEVEKYFDTEESRRCIATPYARAQVPSFSENDTIQDYCWWWLCDRGPDYPDVSLFHASVVTSAGQLYTSSVGDTCAVRPTLIIDLQP